MGNFATTGAGSKLSSEENDSNMPTAIVLLLAQCLWKRRHLPPNRGVVPPVPLSYFLPAYKKYVQPSKKVSSPSNLDGWKLQAECEKEVFEIDLDGDGPLRQEYLPKHHASNPTSQSSQPRENVTATLEHNTINIRKWNNYLPPPVSSAEDEPIFRERQWQLRCRPKLPQSLMLLLPASGCYNPTWDVPIRYTAESQLSYLYYDFPPMVPLNQSNYNPFEQNPSLAISHARTQSFSYDQDLADELY
jgi:hypothetical protein